MLNRDEKIEIEIIKPRDDLIQELHKKNISLRKELSKQSNTVDMATEYEKEHTKMLEDNVNLKFKNLLLGYAINSHILLRMTLYENLKNKHILTLILKNKLIKLTVRIKNKKTIMI